MAEAREKGGHKTSRTITGVADHERVAPRNSSKLHLVTDAQGVPLAVESTAGQAHESTRFEPLIDAPGRWARAIAADKTYDLPRIAGGADATASGP